MAARVFEKVGIDYCCRGSLSLGVACANANVPVETVVQLLETVEQPKELGAPIDPALGDLTHYIVDQHHGFVRHESPRVRALLAKVCDKHSRQHAELLDVQKSFASLDAELAEHMLKEERILFPYIEALERQTELSVVSASIESPVAVMIAEHELAGAILSRIRALTNGYKEPATACPTF